MRPINTDVLASTTPSPQMRTQIHLTGKGRGIEIQSDAVLLHTPADALGLIYEHSADLLIVQKKNVHPDFFDLATGVAGEICQKFVNYQCQLAIVGDYSEITSKSLRDFIFESNRRANVFFPESIETALNESARRA